MVTIGRMSAMEDIPMGLGPLGPFVLAWTVMMAAMMFPSALPLMFEFARHAERRRGWRLATVLLGTDSPANRELIIKNNPVLKKDPDHLVAGQTYWIAAPVADAMK